MSSSQEKTEKATPKRLSEAKSKGQVPRSKDLVSFCVLLTASYLFLMLSQKFYEKIVVLYKLCFVLKSNEIYNFPVLLNKVKTLFLSSFSLLLPFLLIMSVVIYISTNVLGGRVFSFEKIKPKLSNISFKNAAKKWFSYESLFLIAQAVFKTLITSVIVWIIIKSLFSDLIVLSVRDISDAVKYGTHYVFYTFFILSFSCLLYVLIDFPYQKYRNTKNLKMTKQEIKDEYKNIEGNPHIKRRIRSLQKKISRRSRALKNIPKANILITNPTHFAVALQYDENTMNAPVIVAAGTGTLALYIRRISIEYRIPILEIPLLARALYYYGEVGQTIPEELFYVVARVIAYLFKLDNPLSHHVTKEWVDQLEIPEELTVRSDGKKREKIEKK